MPKPTNEAELIAALKLRKPLVKKMHSWPMPWQLHRNKPLFKEVVRITGSIGIDSETPQDAWENAKLVIDELKAEGYAIEICLKMSGWHYKYRKDESLEAQADPTFWGKTCLDEVNYQSYIMEQSALKATANGLMPNVKILWYDQEILRGPAPRDFTGSLEQTRIYQHLDAKNNISWGIGKHYFPQAKIVQHDNVAIWKWTRADLPVSTGRSRPYYWKDSLREFYSVGMYFLDRDTRRNLMRDMVYWSQKEDNLPCVPTISLGGYREETYGAGGEWVWKNYRFINDWNLGNEIMQPYFSMPDKVAEYAPWDKSPGFIMTWPKIADPRSPEYLLHLLAFCMGAESGSAGVKEDWIVG